MRTQLTSGSWVEATATLAASILMTVAGFSALRVLPATPPDNVAAPARAPGSPPSASVAAPARVRGIAGVHNAGEIAMPHVDVTRG